MIKNLKASNYFRGSYQEIKFLILYVLFELNEIIDKKKKLS